MAGYLVPPTKNPGDVLTSALWNSYIRDNLDFGMVRPIADITLGSSAATIDFTSIPATFAHLALVASLRDDRAASAADPVGVRFNNDSTAGRYAGGAYGLDDGSGNVANNTSNTTSIRCMLAAAVNSDAGVAAGNLLWIPAYAQATMAKSVVGLFGFQGALASATHQYAEIAYGTYNQTPAINRITLFPINGTNFVTGSRVTLYGMGGI